MKKGYLYVLKNKSMPGLMKIGKTTYSGTKRADELSNHSGVALEFYVAFQVLVKDIDKSEKLVHVSLDQYRVSKRREFFESDLNKIILHITKFLVEKNLLFQEDSIKISDKTDSSSISNIYFDLGYCQEKEEQFHEAIALYKKAIDNNPDNFQARARRMHCVLENHIYDDFQTQEDTQYAITELSDLIKYDSNDSKLYQLRGVFYMLAALENENQNKNKFKLYLDLSYQDYTSAIEVDSNNSKLYLDIAKLYIYGQIDFAQVETDFDTALSLTDDNPYFYHKRAKFYIHIKDFKKAIEDYEIILKIFPENRHKFRYYEEIGDLYVRTRNYWMAVYHFESAMEKSPHHTAKYHVKISDIYFIQQKYDESEKRLLRAFEISPKGINFKEKMALIKIKKGETREAFQYLIQLLEDRPMKFNKRAVSELRVIYKNQPLLFSAEDITKIQSKIGEIDI